MSVRNHSRSTVSHEWGICIAKVQRPEQHQLWNFLLALFWSLGSVLMVCTTAQAQTVAAGLSANPVAITAGGSSTLTWSTQNAVSADLNGTAVPLNGSQVVSPTATTTYRLTAHSSTGTTDWGMLAGAKIGHRAPRERRFAAG